MTPLYIFDLDGTLALIDHRRHLVEGKPDWPAFHAACVDDVANLPVLKTLRNLRKGGAEVWIFSGRSDEVQNETVKWLIDHADISVYETHLRMRRKGDFTPDDQLKLSWLKEMRPFDRQRLVAVFDDRDKVVAMWRANGVACFQVAPGEL